jgi:lactam utilization protein B
MAGLAMSEEIRVGEPEGLAKESEIAKTRHFWKNGKKISARDKGAPIKERERGDWRT